MQKKILVLGATGLLGKPVAFALRDAGFQVRVMTRDVQKAGEIFDETFELVSGNPADVASVENALDGCSGVHISLPPEVELAAACNVAHVAGGNGLEHITYISGASVSQENRWFPMVDGKYRAEEALRGTGKAVSVFCPTWVMDGLTMFVNEGKAFIIGKQPTPNHWVAAQDIAAMVVKAYELGEGGAGRFIVHGPQAITMREALQRYCTAFHPEAKVSSMPFWMVRMMAMLTRNRELIGVVDMMAYLEKVGEGSNAPQAECVLGTPATTLDQWMEYRKAVEG